MLVQNILLQEHKTILQGVQYTGAIKHYAKKRQDFLTMYNNGIKVDNKHLQKSGVIGQAIQEIQKSNIAQQRDFIYKTLSPAIEKHARTFISGQNSSLFNEVQSLLLKAEKVATEESQQLQIQASQKLDQLMEELFANQELEQIIIEKCKDQLFTGSYNLMDLTTRAKTLRRNMILNLIRGQEQISAVDWTSKNIMAGYYRESMVASALGKVLNGAVKQTGNTKVKRTIDNKTHSIDSAIDVVISDIQNTEHLLQALEGDFIETMNIDTHKSFGIQVKSWSSDKDRYTSDLSIGSRKNLLNRLKQKDRTSWMKGILLFKHTENVLEALGKHNVAWVTGDNFYFTDDFIKMMRKKDYFINFVYRKTNEAYQATNKVRWQQYGTFFEN